jgi:hypothetical protein
VHCASLTSSSRWWLAPRSGEGVCRGVWCPPDLEEREGVVRKTGGGGGLRGDGLTTGGLGIGWGRGVHSDRDGTRR